jgi:hypothetical protein
VSWFSEAYASSRLKLFSPGFAIKGSFRNWVHHGSLVATSLRPRSGARLAPQCPSTAETERTKGWQDPVF